ncbi:MAG: dihydroneopterin aldolase [Myxococcota bacterium]
MPEIRGWVHIRQLSIPDASVGIYPRERRARQPILVDVSVFLAMTEATTHDRIGGTVDYDHIAALVREITLARHYPLIESLACILAEKVLASFSVDEVRIQVHKPDALPDATASVELTLKR